MDRRLRPVALSLTIACVALDASAHGGDGERSAAGALVVAALLALTLALYATGVARLWRSAGRGRGVTRARVSAFVGGWCVLAASLLGPLDAWTARTFTAHMIQHELLMLIAAPLLVVGAPLAVWAWGLPPRFGERALSAARGAARSRVWDVLTRSLAAWLLHAVALWTWHVPALFTAAVERSLVHDLQHASFLGTAILFWWSVIGGRGAKRPEGTSILLLFTTMLHTGALGALLAFSRTPWYAPYAGYGSLTALEDQQLGGLVMWLPGGIVYIVAALALMAVWLRDPEAPAGRI
jgi:putative membrane protein